MFQKEEIEEAFVGKKVKKFTIDTYGETLLEFEDGSALKFKHSWSSNGKIEVRATVFMTDEVGD